MELEFATEELRRYFVDNDYARARLGRDLADRYAYILNLFGCVDTPSDLRRFALLDMSVPITVDGVWSVTLGERRLTFRPAGRGNAITIVGVKL